MVRDMAEDARNAESNGQLLQFELNSKEARGTLRDLAQVTLIIIIDSPRQQVLERIQDAVQNLEDAEVLLGGGAEVEKYLLGAMNEVKTVHDLDTVGDDFDKVEDEEDEEDG